MGDGALLWETVWRTLRKLNTELPSDPPVLLVGIHPGERKEELTQNDTWVFLRHYSQQLQSGNESNAHQPRHGGTKCAVSVQQHFIQSQAEEWSSDHALQHNEPWKYHTKWQKSDTKITRFHLHEKSRVGETKETGNRLVAAKGRRGGKRREDGFVTGTRFLCGVRRSPGITSWSGWHMVIQ